MITFLDDLGIYIYITQKSSFGAWTVRPPLPEKEESFFWFLKNKFELQNYLTESIEKGSPQLLLNQGIFQGCCW